jgi:phage FluMu protein Com
VPYEIGLWSCPRCKAANESPATLAGNVVGSASAEVRRKPVAMHFADACGRLIGKQSLYGYADRVIDVECPRCKAGLTMTTNVRIARCVSCEAVVRRA